MLYNDAHVSGTGSAARPLSNRSAHRRGRQGEVYRASDTRLDRTVAIKILPPHFAESDKLRRRFEQEARGVSRLNHRHMCTLFDIGEENGVLFLVMEVKAIEPLLPIHEAQLLSYLKLGGWKLGLLINFHVPVLKEGIRRVVLSLEEP